MKTDTKFIILFFALILSSALSHAQVAVNADGALPDASAMLDVKSTSSGLLVPRMTSAQRDAIASPAKGLLIYCTSDEHFYVNSGKPTVPVWVMLNSDWSKSGTSLYYNGGNIGIGESNPSYPLNFGYSLGEKISLHGSGATHYGFGIQNYQMQMFTDASNSDISFGYGSSAAFTENLRIKGTGQVGIGNTAPLYPLSFGLFFGDKISLSPPTYPYFNHFGLGIQFGEMQLFTDAIGSDITFGYKSLSGGFNERVRIKGNGRLGIGTSAPAYKLDVAGDINTNGLLRVNGVPVNSSQWTTTGSDIYYNSGCVMAGASTAPANTRMFVSSDATGNNVDVISLKTLAKGQMNITGYLGNAEGTGNANKVKGIDLTVHGKGDLYGMFLTMSDESNDNVNLTGTRMTLVGSNNNMQKNGLDISITTPANAGTNVHSGICYGVKSTSLSNRSDAYGGYFEGEVNNLGMASVLGGWSAYGVKARATNLNYIESLTAKAYAIYGEVDWLGDPNTNPPTPPPLAGHYYAGYFNGDLGGTGAFSYVSDGKFKENVTPIENALEKIKKLNPSSYNFNNKAYPRMHFASGTRFGFIAQDLEKVIPEVVKDDIFPEQYDKKGNLVSDAVQYKGVVYNEIIPILAAGIREQQEIIEKQESTINDLRNQVAGLNDRITALEQILKK